MADSYMLKVEKALCDHVEAFVSPAQDRPIDLTDSVFRARAYIGGRGSKEPIPMVSLLMAPEVEPETIEAGLGRKRTRDVLYFFQGWTEPGVESETDPAHELLAEVKKALSNLMFPETNDYYMLRAYHPNNRPMIQKLEVGMGLVRPPEDQVSPTAAYFWLPIRLGLIESPADPYELP